MSIDRQSVLNKLGWCEMVSSATGCGGVTVDTKTIEECKTLIEELIGENERLGIGNFDLICELSRIKENTVREMQERLDKHFCHDPAFLGVEQRLIMDVIDQIAKEMTDEK